MSKIGSIALAAFLALFAAITDVAAQDTYWPTRDWRTSSPEAQGMDSRILADAFDFVREHNVPIHSVTIVRNGYIVLDAYFWPFQDNQLHDLASVTKSVTSTLAGIAIGQHKLSGLAQPVLEVFAGRRIANTDARKQRITIEDLLTMTSGLDCHFDRGEITLSQMMAGPDWIQFMLDLPSIANPGATYEYCSGGMHLLSGAIARATGTKTVDFAQGELFTPLGITNFIWPTDPQGIARGWGDLHLQPRDMTKLGYLWLRNGRWEDRQIVPADWMRAATQVHSHPGFSPGQEYGFGIWIYPNRKPPEFEGLGRGGQRISVIPAKNLVVVFTGGTFEPGDIGAFIGRAIKADQPLPENPAGVARLAAAVGAAARRRLPRPMQPAPSLAQTISGKTYALDANPLDVKSLTLTFSGASEAALALELSDRRDGPRPVGLDGEPRVSPNGRYGLPVALSGAWESDSVFALVYNEVGNINSYHFRITFVREAVAVELSEKSGVFAAVRFRGRALAPLGSRNP